MKAATFFLTCLTLTLLSGGCRRDMPARTLNPDGPISASLSTNRAYVGDVLDVNLFIAHPAGATISWPDLGSEKSIVVRDRSIEAQSPTSSLARWSVASYELGRHAIWSGTVTVATSEGAPTTYALPPLELTVESILPAAGDTWRNPRGLLKWPRAPLTRLWLALATICIAAALVALLVRFLARGRTHPAQAAPPLPAHEKALRALAALEKETRFEAAAAETFFVAVSSIVRVYLEDRFDLRAPEQTTEEFIRSASSANVLRMEHQHVVTDFLVECDLVKFARHEPGAERMRQALAAAYRLVRETAQPAGGAT